MNNKLNRKLDSIVENFVIKESVDVNLYKYIRNIKNTNNHSEISNHHLNYQSNGSNLTINDDNHKKFEHKYKESESSKDSNYSPRVSITAILSNYSISVWNIITTLGPLFIIPTVIIYIFGAIYESQAIGSIGLSLFVTYLLVAGLYTLIALPGIFLIELIKAINEQRHFDVRVLFFITVSIIYVIIKVYLLVK